MKRPLLCIGVGACLIGSALPAFAIQVTDNLQIGAALRARIDYDPDRDIEKLNFDTFRPYINYTSDSWIASARYRFYGKAYPYQYTKKFGDISFPEYAWIGYKFDENRQVQVGLNQVPFGIQPYFSNTVTETLGYTLGLEDLNEVGAKYKQKFGDWDLQAGYYVRPAFQGKGTSKGGVTYSNAPTDADSYVTDGSNNQERNMVALRIAKAMDLGGWKTELGASALTSELQNRDTDNNGRRNALGLHLTSSKGPWTTGFLAARQQMSPRNPGNDDFVTLGGYDSSYNIASRGTLLVADLNYDIGGKYLGDTVNSIKLYGNYSAFLKSGDGYQDTQRYIGGVSFMVGNYVFIATEWIFGKNDPYVGGSSYTQSLAAGGTNHWENQVLSNIGFYF
jgi:hypothetical protein